MGREVEFHGYPISSVRIRDRNDLDREGNAGNVGESDDEMADDENSLRAMGGNPRPTENRRQKHTLPERHKEIRRDLRGHTPKARYPKKRLHSRHRDVQYHRHRMAERRAEPTRQEEMIYRPSLFGCKRTLLVEDNSFEVIQTDSSGGLTRS